MSGRPYARNPNGQLGGATDLEAVLPHRFRLETARSSVLSSREQAVRRIIRERCREKNWKKLLIRRQQAEESEAEPQDEQPIAVAEAEAQAPVEPAPETTEDPAENAKQRILELETALKTLAEQKHAKFLELKEMLVEEARSRSSVAPAAAAAPAPTSTPSAPAPTDAPTTKKRRVEFAVSSPRGVAVSSPRPTSAPTGQDTIPVSEAPTTPADNSGVGP